MDGATRRHAVLIKYSILQIYSHRLDVGVAHSGEGGGVFGDLTLVFAVGVVGIGAGLEVHDPGAVGSEDYAVGTAHFAIDGYGGFALDAVLRVEEWAVFLFLHHCLDALRYGLGVGIGDVVVGAVGGDNAVDLVDGAYVCQQVVDDDAVAPAVGLESRQESLVLGCDAYAVLPGGIGDAVYLDLACGSVRVGFGADGLRFLEVGAYGVGAVRRLTELAVGCGESVDEGDVVV